MDDQIKNKEQITAIKERLNRYREEAGLTLGALTEKINQETDIEVNYNTLRSTLDFSKDVINTFVVIGICRCLGKDIAMTLSPPGTKDNTLQNTSDDFLGSGKFVVLDDPKCIGTFYGYFPTGNPEVSRLTMFTLEIRQVGDTTKAIMKHYKSGSFQTDKVDTPPEVLTGTPYCDTVHSEIFILLTNDQGGFYFLYFKKPAFHSSQLYFSRGIALRPATHKDTTVVYMSFMLLRHPISEEDECCVSGMLSSIQPTFLISENNLQALRQSNPLVETFCEEFGYLLDHDKRQFYEINESMILTSHRQTMTTNEVIQAMMLLKDYSTSPKRIRYDEQSAYYDFARDYLQKPKSQKCQE